MRKTLVLVVDRDDDFGVKGKVNTPVVGVQKCLDAATSLGIADPEDSDLNALYAAISTCLEIQEDGHDAEVALICGDEKVGHRSDLALKGQLEEVLDEIQPDGVVLVGDGAEDEYIYPIVSSRAYVDSVRKVYVKQAPGLEGSFYILSRMLSDPAKRKRFLVPLGFFLMMISLVFMMPSMLVFVSERDLSTITGMSGSLVVFLLGLTLMLYGYNFSYKMSQLKVYLIRTVFKQSTRFIFFVLALSVIALSALWVFYEVQDMYVPNGIALFLYYASSMMWPFIMALVVYVIGAMIQDYQEKKQVRMSQIFGCLSLTSMALVGIGILDLLQAYVSGSHGSTVGIMEIISGIVLSIMLNFIRSRTKNQKEKGAGADEVL